MKRALLIILMLLLPLQLSWAAMASYCQNEGDQTYMHWGHHEHQASQKPLAKSLSTPDGTSKKTFGTDAECGLCHLSCFKSAISYKQLTSFVDFNTAAYPLIPSNFSSHIAEGPEKPNWQLAA